MKLIQFNEKIRFLGGNIAELPKLDVGNYLLSYDKDGIYLQPQEGFHFKGKIYESPSDIEFLKRVKNSWDHTKGNLGILLSGEKGQGKTILAKRLCILMGLPVIIIDSSLPESIDFSTFLGQFSQDIILLVDEFEKKFSSWEKTEDGTPYHTQGTFLTLLDGVRSSAYKKLCIFTVNGHVDDLLLNRPSRIKYKKTYSGMESGLYNEIIKDKLKYPEYEEDLRAHLPLSDCNVDLLFSVIEEINIHNEPFSKFVEMYNFTPSAIVYNCKLEAEGAMINLHKYKLKRDIGDFRGYPVRSLSYNLETDLLVALKITEPVELFTVKFDGTSDEEDVLEGTLVIKTSGNIKEYPVVFEKSTTVSEIMKAYVL